MEPDNKSVKIISSRDVTHVYEYVHKLDPGFYVLTIDIDIGEACLVLYVDENKKIQFSALIDGGHEGKSRRVTRILRLLGIKELTLAVITHFDGDHQEGMFHVLTKTEIKAKSIWVRTTDTSNIDKPNGRSILKDLISIYGAAVVSPSPGNYKFFNVPLTIEVLCCENRFYPEALENYGSIALMFQCGDYSYYCAGDLPSSAETNLWKSIKGKRKRFLVAKCGHHGSKFSTSEEFLEKTDINLALIGAGHHPGYGHPTMDIVERLVKAQLPTVITNCVFNRKNLNPEATSAQEDVINPKQVDMLVEYAEREEYKDFDGLNKLTKILTSADLPKDKIVQAIAWFETYKNSNLVGPLATFLRAIKRLESHISDTADFAHIHVASKIDRGHILLHMVISNQVVDPKIYYGSSCYTVTHKSLDYCEEEQRADLPNLFVHLLNSPHYLGTSDPLPDELNLRSSVNDWKAKRQTVPDNFVIPDGTSGSSERILTCVFCKHEDTDVISMSCESCTRGLSSHIECFILWCYEMAVWTPFVPLFDQVCEQFSQLNSSNEIQHVPSFCSSCNNNYAGYREQLQTLLEADGSRTAWFTWSSVKSRTFTYLNSERQFIVCPSKGK